MSGSQPGGYDSSGVANQIFALWLMTVSEVTVIMW